MVKVTDSQITEILTELRGSGASLKELTQHLGGDISRRTLQRKLQGLIQKREISKTGKARATRYKIITHLNFQQERPPSLVREDPAPINVPKKLTPEPASDPEPKEGESGPDYSTVARDVINIVRAPQEMRKPVGYRREFLDSYHPNKTFYLPQELRQRLTKIGRNQHYDSLPAGTHARQIFDRLIIDLSWNSSRLEGNTFSLLETN